MFSVQKQSELGTVDPFQIFARI